MYSVPCLGEKKVKGRKLKLLLMMSQEKEAFHVRPFTDSSATLFSVCIKGTWRPIPMKCTFTAC